jgi:hypothetical protein
VSAAGKCAPGGEVERRGEAGEAAGGACVAGGRRGERGGGAGGERRPRQVGPTCRRLRERGGGREGRR